MNPITKFFHELLNPHCQHCHDLKIEEIEQNEITKICNSCEILKIELAKANIRIDQLLDKLTEKPTVEIPEVSTVERKPIQTRLVPWTVKKQQLEQQSREKAAALRNAATPDVTKDSIKELEKEMGIDNGSKETVNS